MTVLTDGPTEPTSVADDEQYESIRTVLEEKLAEWMPRIDDPLLAGPVPPADYDTIEPRQESNIED